MRLSTFNVENMFERPVIMNLPTWDQGKQVLQDYAQLTEITQKEQYTQDDKNEMLTLMEQNDGLLKKGESAYIRLNEVRGKFLKRKQDGTISIIPDGRADWVGWFELKKEPVKEKAIENTARVMREINADIQCVVEAENRVTLNHFNDSIIPIVGGQKFGHVMLIDGNDDRGIDVGIMTQKELDIQSITSHVDDFIGNEKIFSRDCPEYEFKTSSGKKLLVLVNHLKSKGYGTPAQSNAKRERQATRVRKIYDARIGEGWEFIAIAGDFNDTPESGPLQPLLGNGSDLIDISQHNNFQGDNRPGTFGNGTASQKIDYILMSPKLADKVQGGGIERRGVWGGVNGTLFPHFPEITNATEAASDHAALWADLDI
ncbi:MAG: endonuclease/exonuclease/phosphatase family protein [Thaumarchaeota archaeon]|nr:endonuclease/exonuclease/phosphatase family protein [Nitrososphaerota archaeon]